MKDQDKTTPPPLEVLEAFKEQYTQALHERLILFASVRCSELTWHGILGGAPLRGKEPGDYVQEAIQLFFVGRRKWDPEKCSLKAFLEGVIRSTTNHNSEDKENTDTIRSRAANEQGEEIDLMDQLPSNELSFEEKEKIEERETRLWEFIDFLSDHPEISPVFEAIYDGVIKPASIAERLGISVNEVTNRKKRLATKVEQFKKLQTAAL